LPLLSYVAPGGQGTFVIARDGTVWSWGIRTQISGRFADPFAVAGSAFRTPGQVIGLSSIVDVDCHDWGGFAVKNDGTVWVWGNGSSGWIGDNEAWANVPTAIVGFGGASTTLSTLGTGSTADSWFFQNFSVPELLNDSLISDLATPAGDGIPNLVKYALGLNPKLRYGASSLPTARVDLIGNSAQSAGLFSLPTVNLLNGKRYLAFTVPRNAGIRQDINYTVEVSTDLVTWSSGDPHTVTVLDTAETLEVYSAQSLDDVPKQFMRLKITRK
jgi:hypothetical protein